MSRVLIACNDVILSGRLHNAFECEDDFQVCGNTENSFEAIDEAIKLQPNLVILAMVASSKSGFEVATELKRTMPDVPIFLVTEQCDASKEKEAFRHGVDAVFEEDFDCQSIVMNARAACAVELGSSCSALLIAVSGLAFWVRAQVVIPLLRNLRRLAMEGPFSVP
jgi:DNA-binding NarL/FixJ family response regulator